MNNKSWKLTYNLLTNDGVEKIEAQFMYFETCIMTVKNLSKHCCIDNIHISLIKYWGKTMLSTFSLLISLFILSITIFK